MPLQDEISKDAEQTSRLDCRTAKRHKIRAPPAIAKMHFWSTHRPARKRFGWTNEFSERHKNDTEGVAELRWHGYWRVSEIALHQG